MNVSCETAEDHCLEEQILFTRCQQLDLLAGENLNPRVPCVNFQSR
jgi:hypothetical protein